jgi:hypothetical protein
MAEAVSSTDTISVLAHSPGFELTLEHEGERHSVTRQQACVQIAESA